MSPASGPVQNPKTFPAAVMDDQAAILDDDLGRPTIMGTPPFSSPDPATDAIKMLPLEDGTSAHNAALDAAYEREASADSATDSTDYNKLKVPGLREQMESRELDHDGMKKDDMVSALLEDDASDMKASDFKDKVDAATTQEELDAVGELYEAQDKTYATVEAAIEKKQNELDSDEDN